MEQLKLSPPWNTFVSELRALFGDDPDIKIDYKDGEYEVKLLVANAEKADALMQLLPAQRLYGNVIFKVIVVPADTVTNGNASLFEKAFKGNPVLSDIVKVDTPFGAIDYVVFQKKVVQFYNDDMSDLHGNKSTLYADIAMDVFGDSDVFFCTDVKDIN